jgi:hypothetical protein
MLEKAKLVGLKAGANINIAGHHYLTLPTLARVGSANNVGFNTCRGLAAQIALKTSSPSHATRDSITRPSYIGNELRLL